MLGRRALPVFVGVGLMLSGIGGWASAAVNHPASTPGWRPVTHLGPANGVTYPLGLVATSAKDAWSIWDTCVNCGGIGPDQQYNRLEHWTGRVWRRVSVPAAVGTLLQGVSGLAATSADDLWMFDGNRAAHWSGKHWRIIKIPAWVVISDLSGNIDSTVADFGPRNLWVFSGGLNISKLAAPKPTLFFARYDGHRWTKAWLPGIPNEISVVGPADIWTTAVPANFKGRSFLMHWNGRSWSKLAMPRPREVPAHFAAHLRNLLAIGPRDVWLQEDVSSGQDILRTHLYLHWNGRRWQTVSFRWPTSYVQSVAPDGHSGLWLSDESDRRQQPWLFAHYSAGRWTRVPVPPPAGMDVQGLRSLIHIPGTRSMWATGGILPVHTTTVIIGAIWKYGA
jgi:hypothetical protein